MKQLEIKKKYFDIFDGALACLIFVILQFIFSTMLTIIPREMFQSGFVTFLNVCLEMLFVAASVITAVLMKKNIPVATTLNKKINWSIVGLALAVAVISLITFSGITNGFMAILESFGYSAVTGGGVDVSNFGKYVIAIFTVCAVPAFCEELLFRGVVLNSFRGLNKWLGIFLSGFFFMIMHGNPDQTIHQFLLGVILGYIAWETKNIWVTMLIHFFNNFIAITISFVSQFIVNSSSAEGGVASWSTILTTLLIGAGMCALGIWVIIMLTKFMKKQSDKVNAEHKEIVVENSEQTDNIDSSKKEEFTQDKPNKYKVVGTVLCYVIFVGYFLYEWIRYLIIGFNH